MWQILVNTAFLPSDDLVQEVFAFAIAQLQMTAADAPPIESLFCQTPAGHPPYDIFVKSNIIMN